MELIRKFVEEIIAKGSADDLLWGVNQSLEFGKVEAHEVTDELQDVD